MVNKSILEIRKKKKRKTIHFQCQQAVQSNEAIGQNVEFQGKDKGTLVITGLVIADPGRVDSLLFTLVGPFTNQSPRHEELTTKN